MSDIISINKDTHETHFTDGTEIDSYLAAAYAEGFCEGDGASEIDILKAWSYVCGTGLYKGLQGFFGRTVNALIDSDIMNSKGVLNVELLKEKGVL